MEAVFSLKHFNVGKNKTKNTLTHSALFPSTAYDYLQRVQEEAALCPDVVVAQVDCSHFLENQDASFTAEECMISSSGDNQPSEEWQQQQTASFAEIRQFLVQHKSLMKKQKNSQKKHLPPSENESEWFHFCFGQQNSKNKLNPSIQEEKSEGVCSNGAVEQGDEGSPALLSIISQMNQPTVLCVLDHHINWLETRSFSHLQGQWIYALLAAIEKPLLADTTYSLRSLARLCSKQKENLTPTQNKEMAALYLIITIITRYFGQSDLARPS